MSDSRCAIVVDSFYHGNRLFRLDDPIANRDNCLVGFARLKESLAERGFTLATDDLVSVNEANVVIFNEMPKALPEKDVLAKSVLLIFECEVIRPDNWDPEKLSKFPVVLTWNDQLVEEKRGRKMNFPVDLTTLAGDQPWKSKKLCTLIAGNKVAKGPKELYSERRRAIGWFERNHPEAFEFFGPGWNSRVFGGALRPLNRVPLLLKILSRRYQCYRGLAQGKRQTLANYRFCICFENAHSIPGYITEKLLDCLAAGVIPVYWGAPNITDHIPEDCFVDFRRFRGYRELYSYLSSMSEQEHQRIVECGRQFLQSDQGRLFGPGWFAERVSEAVLDLHRSAGALGS